MSAVLDLFRRKTSRRAEIPVLPTFEEAFEWASERRLHVLYDEIADMLDREFSQLREAGGAQLEVLRRIAIENDLPEYAFAEPLEDEESETLVRRVAWRTAAQWAVLSLLWRLAKLTPVTGLSTAEWASASSGDEWADLLGSSGLPGVDEPTALAFASDELQCSFASKDVSALLVSDRPLLLYAPNETTVTASLTRPVALVAGSPDRLEPHELSLSKGDRLWPAGDLTGSPLEMYAGEPGEAMLITERQTVPIGEPYQLVPVVHGIALLCER